MTTIKFYSELKNEYQSFSNFYKTPFQVKIKDQLTTFPTVEHYFHFQKAFLFDDKEAQHAILNTNDPLEVKRIGRTVKNFNPTQWEAVAPKHIANGMYLKFTQNQTLKKQLLETKNTLLEEANPYDNKYGIGKNGDGQNITGKCLMQVRDLIAEKEKQSRQIQGDLTSINNGYIMHQVNCQNVMGAGVAKALYSKYPRVKEAYHEFATKHPNPKDRLGKIQPVNLDSNPNLKIFNAYTQLYYGNSAKTKKVYTDENKLIDALTRFDQRAKQDNQPAYVPAKIGCGLAGGNWERIKKHILDNTNITIVELPQRQPEKTITKEQSDEFSL